MGLNPSELIRMALDCIIFNENRIEMIKSKKKENSVLVYKSTVNLNKTQVDRIFELSEMYGFSLSKIVKRM